MTENREGTGLPPRSPGSPSLSAARCRSHSSARRQQCAEPPGGGCSDSLWWAPSKWCWKRKGKRLGAGVVAERGVWPLLTQEEARTSLGDTMEVLGLFWMFCCGSVSVTLKADRILSLWTHGNLMCIHTSIPLYLVRQGRIFYSPVTANPSATGLSTCAPSSCTAPAGELLQQWEAILVANGAFTSFIKFMKRPPNLQALCRWHCRELTVIWGARW